ncbi:MAG: Hsp70 family protein, partial [Burkholderiaceae bacterium]|nr:Hsp70 family protein [Burkholderiaceae bacterium]
EDEIQKMVKDAEANKAEDHRRFELAQARNQADASVHQIRKALAEHGGSLDAAEREKIEAAVKEAEEALKGDDREAIEAKTAAMMTVSQKLGEKMYAGMQGGAAGAAAGEAAGASAQAGGGEAKPKDDDVVDADFKEVRRS